MTKFKNEADLYLRQYPDLLKWINQCAACQRRGYRPETPAEIFPGVAGRNLRKYFDELALSEDGLCEQCARHSRGTTMPNRPLQTDRPSAGG
jgi:hypothetical protein